MKKKLEYILAFTLVILFSCHLFAQDTFSIVAVDTITGEIGRYPRDENFIARRLNL